MPALRIHTTAGPVRTLPVSGGLSLAQAVYLAGVWPVLPLCSGLGRCGLCRVRFLSAPPAPSAAEIKRISRADRDAGWRLACQHPAGEGGELFVPDPPRSLAATWTAEGTSTGRGQPESLGEAQTPEGAPLLLAVDLGTTSICWSAGRVEGGRAEGGRFVPRFSGQALNPQIGLGSEVMSRLAAARAGLGRELSALVLDHLRGIIAELPAPVSALALAGNPAMTALTLGWNTDGLAAAPYRLADTAGEERTLGPDLPRAFVAPLLAPFVGGDLSAGLAALAFLPEHGLAYPFVLADLGTNGEFVLGLDPEHFLLASVPLGPALEGVGLSLGRVAGPGVAVAFAAGPAGLAPRWLDRPPLPGQDPALSGTGYLSLLAQLLGLGLLDRRGAWAEPSLPLARRMARFTDHLGEKSLDLGGGIVLPPSDVEETLKVKATFNLALSRLLAEAGLTPPDLAQVHLAGAMGRHVRPGDLAALGFLPPGMEGRVRAAGNTSLSGAELFLARPEAREWARGLPGRCRLVDLAAWPEFNPAFLARMVFDYVP
jgi:uncharacterized 2Fe-2S/4Fe-4S cluster protein (DUF4445 family)